jgi:hypothetical protein
VEDIQNRFKSYLRHVDQIIQTLGAMVKMKDGEHPKVLVHKLEYRGLPWTIAPDVFRSWSESPRGSKILIHVAQIWFEAISEVIQCGSPLLYIHIRRIYSLIRSNKITKSAFPYECNQYI